MPIGVQNFSILSPEQANPLGESIYKAMMSRNARLAGDKALAELPYAGLTAKSTADYKTAMAKYLMSPGGQGRGLSNIGKMLNEQAYGVGQHPLMTNENVDASQQNAQMGMPQATSAPGFNPPNREGVNPYGLAIQKSTTDSDVRKKELFSENMEKTMQMINPKDLTRYSGLKGLLEKLFEQGKEATKGFTGVGGSGEYQNYQESKRSAHQLAKQVRQFYGDSIQPSVAEDLDMMTNPEAWDRSPEMAMQLYEKYKNLLGMETGTYKGALNQPRQGEQTVQSPAQMAQMAQPQQMPQMPQQQAPAPNQSEMVQGISQAQLQQMAQEAIDAGRSPEAVAKMMAQLGGGAQ